MQIGIEVKQVTNQEELDNLIPTMKQYLQLGQKINVSWKLTQQDIFEHTYKINQHLENDEQVEALTKLLQKCDAYPDLKKRITLTLSLYQLEKKKNYQESINLLISIKDRLRFQARTQQLKVLKKLKEKIKEIDDAQLIKQIVETCLQQNQICKEDVRRILDEKQQIIDPNEEIKMWFYEQILNYETKNQSLLIPLFNYYYKQNDIQQMDKIYQSIFPNDEELNKEQKKIKFDQLSETYEKKLQQIDLLKSVTSSQKSDKLQELYQLKIELGFPILEYIQNILDHIIILKNSQNLDVAIQIIDECLLKITLEKLINYNLKIVAFESLLFDLLGECSKRLEKYNEALKFFQIAARTKDEAKHYIDYKSNIYTKMQLATIYYKLNQFDEALETFEDVYKLQVNNNDELHKQGSTENNIASILFAKGQKLKALEYSKRALIKLRTNFSEKDLVYEKVKQLHDKIEANL